MLSWIFVAVILQAGPAPAPAPAEWRPEALVLTRRPVPRFPDLALSNRTPAGRVTLDCVVGAGGTFSGCQVVDETPPGNDFGEAAVESMRRARFSEGPGAPRSGDIVRGVVIGFVRPPR